MNEVGYALNQHIVSLAGNKPRYGAKQERCGIFLPDLLYVIFVGLRVVGKAVCVIDNLSGINTPKKIGPMLKTADIVVITKGDIVSQAEREVFASKVRSVNPKATTMHINGLTGQGAYELGTLLYDEKEDIETVKGKELRFSMPSALCSYCLGEKRIGDDYQMGNVRKIEMGENND